MIGEGYIKLVGIANLSKIKNSIPCSVVIITILGLRAFSFMPLKPEIDVAPINSNEHISLTTFPLHVMQDSHMMINTMRGCMYMCIWPNT